MAQKYLHLLLFVALFWPKLALTQTETVKNAQDLLSEHASFIHRPKASAKQIARAMNGETIIIAEKDSSLGGTAVGFSPEAIEKVWKVITDYASYPQFMPRCLKTEIVEQNPQFLMLKSVYASRWPFPDIWNLSQVMHQVPYSGNSEPPTPEQRVMSWKAQKTNLKMNFGFWFLEKNPQGTLIFYENNFDIPWVPQGLARSSAKKSLVQTVNAVRKRAGVL